jgi:hypothetical protein
MHICFSKHLSQAHGFFLATRSDMELVEDREAVTQTLARLASESSLLAIVADKSVDMASISTWNAIMIIRVRCNAPVRYR